MKSFVYVLGLALFCVSANAQTTTYACKNSSLDISFRLSLEEHEGFFRVLEFSKGIPDHLLKVMDKAKQFNFIFDQHGWIQEDRARFSIFKMKFTPTLQVSFAWDGRVQNEYYCKADSNSDPSPNQHLEPLHCAGQEGEQCQAFLNLVGKAVQIPKDVSKRPDRDWWTPFVQSVWESFSRSEVTHPQVLHWFETQWPIQNFDAAHYPWNENTQQGLVKSIQREYNLYRLRRFVFDNLASGLFFRVQNKDMSIIPVSQEAEGFLQKQLGLTTEEFHSGLQRREVQDLSKVSLSQPLWFECRYNRESAFLFVENRGGGGSQVRYHVQMNSPLSRLFQDCDKNRRIFSTFNSGPLGSTLQYHCGSDYLSFLVQSKENLMSIRKPENGSITEWNCKRLARPPAQVFAVYYFSDQFETQYFQSNSASASQPNPEFRTPSVTGKRRAETDLQATGSSFQDQVRVAKQSYQRAIKTEKEAQQKFEAYLSDRAVERDSKSVFSSFILANLNFEMAIYELKQAAGFQDIGKPTKSQLLFDLGNCHWKKANLFITMSKLLPPDEADDRLMSAIAEYSHAIPYYEKVGYYELVVKLHRNIAELQIRLELPYDEVAKSYAHAEKVVHEINHLGLLSKETCDEAKLNLVQIKKLMDKFYKVNPK